MRWGLCVAVAALGMAASPAEAANYVVSISGSVTGTTVTTLCASGPGCLPSAQTKSDLYSGSFSKAIGTLDLKEGDNAFSFGSLYSGGLFSGIITNNGGVLTGSNLSFSLQTCSAGAPSVGCQVTTGSARLFAVSGGVPEPATWALMLMGFGAVGSALRRSRRPAAARVAFAR